VSRTEPQAYHEIVERRGGAGLLRQPARFVRPLELGIEPSDA